MIMLSGASGALGQEVVAIEGGHSGETHEMAGPASLNYDEVTAILSVVRGETIRYNPISPEEHYSQIKALGIPEYL